MVTTGWRDRAAKRRPTEQRKEKQVSPLSAEYDDGWLPYTNNRTNNNVRFHFVFQATLP